MLAVPPLHLCMSRGGVFAAPWTARLAVVSAAPAVAAGLAGVTSFANTGGAAGEENTRGDIGFARNRTEIVEPNVVEPAP